MGTYPVQPMTELHKMQKYLRNIRCEYRLPRPVNPYTTWAEMRAAHEAIRDVDVLPYAPAPPIPPPAPVIPEPIAPVGPAEPTPAVDPVIPVIILDDSDDDTESGESSHSGDDIETSWTSDETEYDDPPGYVDP